MKTISINNQYSTSTFTGSAKECVAFLRSEAKEKRRNSRIANKLEDTVHSIPAHLHQSKLVTIASFKLNGLKSEELINLLNAHGAVKYSIN